MTDLPSISFDGGERQQLMDFLNFQRAVLVRKAEGLTDEQARQSLAPSNLTLAGLVKHSIFVEDIWAVYRFAGQDMIEPWASVDWDASPDWELTSASEDKLTDLLDALRAAWARSDEIYAGAESLDQPAARPREDEPFNLRWILIHLIEEYARHLGHADFLRQSIDGATGD